MFLLLSNRETISLFTCGCNFESVFCFLFSIYTVNDIRTIVKGGEYGGRNRAKS